MGLVSGGIWVCSLWVGQGGFDLVPFRPGAKGERERKKERRVSLLSSPARWSGHHGSVVPARRFFDTGACVSVLVYNAPSVIHVVPLFLYLCIY